jgi:hypothetical protein
MGPFVEKTRGQKSRATVPLTGLSQQILDFLGVCKLNQYFLFTTTLEGP